MQYFDYESIAREAQIPEQKTAQWREVFRREYPGDEMMVELRLLRACEAAKRSGKDWQAIDEALGAEAAAGRP